ncbi:hypothetical protein KM043_004033 [Ampulex compressa]|nr:hypothetical protein KM043_004033 [Ampulex compressa]
MPEKRLTFTPLPRPSSFLFVHLREPEDDGAKGCRLDRKVMRIIRERHRRGFVGRASGVKMWAHSVPWASIGATWDGRGHAKRTVEPVALSLMVAQGAIGPRRAFPVSPGVRRVARAREEAAVHRASGVEFAGGRRRRSERGSERPAGMKSVD